MSISIRAEQRPCCICLTIKGLNTDYRRGATICGGCKKRFCHTHYENHRANIDNEFEQLRKEHSILANQLNSLASVGSVVSSLVEQINQWEAETIGKVRFAAVSARTNVAKLIQDRDIIKNELKKFTTELENEESTHEYDEIDIEDLKSKLSALQQQTRNLSNEKIAIKYQHIKWNGMISIYKTDSHSIHPEQIMQLGANPLYTKEYFCDTTLLTPYQETILNEFCETPNYQWQRLYKATIDGFKPKAFHRYCDKKGPTVIIYRDITGRYLFGGFTRAQWISPWTSYATQRDSRAFLFTLTNPHSLPPTKFPIRSDAEPAIFTSRDFGPSFGLVGCDSDIYYNRSGECHIYFPKSYRDTTDLNYGRKIFTGTDCFQLSEIEVFTLSYKKSI